MVNLNSLIGYSTRTLTDPVVTYSPSSVGYVTKTLVDPVPPPPAYVASQVGYKTTTLSDPVVNHGRSLIGYATKTLLTPGSTRTGSQIGFATKTLLPPHRPISVFMADGSLKYVPVRTWDGTQLR